LLFFPIAFLVVGTEWRHRQERLAEEADLHRTYIGGIERALRNVSLRNIAKLAHAFGVPVAVLFMNDKKSRPMNKLP
jgi:transcriptional regulator with XRE-family HTH domain